VSCSHCDVDVGPCGIPTSLGSCCPKSSFFFWCSASMADTRRIPRKSLEELRAAVSCSHCDVDVGPCGIPTSLGSCCPKSSFFLCSASMADTRRIPREACALSEGVDNLLEVREASAFFILLDFLFMLSVSEAPSISLAHVAMASTFVTVACSPPRAEPSHGPSGGSPAETSTPVFGCADSSVRLRFHARHFSSAAVVEAINTRTAAAAEISEIVVVLMPSGSSDGDAGKGADGGDGGGNGGGYTRAPQSRQSVPMRHKANSLPLPPSSHTPSEAYLASPGHVLEQMEGA